MTKVMLLQSHAPTVNYTPPLGLAYLGAMLEQVGCEVRILDASAPYASYTLRELVVECVALRPDLIGIGIMIPWAQYSYQLIGELHRAVDVPIVAGGPHPTQLPEEALNHHADIVVRGEGEYAIQDLVRWLQGDARLEDIAGLSYRADGKIRHNPSRTLIQDLNALPFPAKHLFVREHYVKAAPEINKFRTLISSRGCPFGCTYCSKPVFGTAVRMRSAASVLMEMESLMETYGMRSFNFVDDLFTVNKRRVIEFCDTILEKKLKINWKCIARLNTVDAELLAKMKRAGCVGINYGVESGSAETLRRARRGYTVEQAEAALKMTYDAGIPCQANFMYGFPWETPEHIEQTIHFIKKIELFVEMIPAGGILEPTPGTALYEEYKDEYRFQGWWLKRRLPTKPSERATVPFFERVFFVFHNLDNNFFDYSPAMKKAIRKAGCTVGNIRLLHYARRLTKNALLLRILWAMLYTVVLVSRSTYRVSPRLEGILMSPVLKLAERYQEREWC
ncbi:MAG: B12-binding domain-containing radical SAM protein [Chloroflexi bacterium]|nr:B12-binding domain-containing radical SAM protein [Chloroflexota bacterium]